MKIGHLSIELPERFYDDEPYREGYLQAMSDLIAMTKPILIESASDSTAFEIPGREPTCRP